MSQTRSPFVIGARIILRSAGDGELTVGTLCDVHPEMWTIELAEPIEPGSFTPGSTMVISTAAAGGLACARTQLLRRSQGTFVISRPQGHDHRDRRRDARLPAAGLVEWASRTATGIARVVDVSRSGMKLEACQVLRVGESVVLDVAAGVRVSALVVGITEGGEERHAHVAFTRITEGQRDEVVEALADDGGGNGDDVVIDLTSNPFVFEVPA